METDTGQHRLAIVRPPKKEINKLFAFKNSEEEAECRRLIANREAERKRRGKFNKKQAKSLKLNTPLWVFWKIFCDLDEDNFGEITNDWSEIIDHLEYDEKLGFVVPATTKDEVPFRMIGCSGQVVHPTKRVMNLVLKALYLEFLSLWTPTLHNEFLTSLEDEAEKYLYWKIMD
jgi:hypothetical protein